MQKIIFLLMSLLTFKVFAQQAPSALRSGRSGLVSQTLGATCYTLDISADTLPCNPAYMAKERTRIFRANAFIGNNVSYLLEASDIASGKADSKTIDTLFSDRKSSEFEADIEAGFLSDTFGIAITPYRVSFYSLFQNPALPEITLFASLESSARMQIASYIQDDIYLGLQVRYLQRKFIASRFFLTDVLAENHNQYLNPQDQTFLFLEPGFLYSNERNEWKPEVSANIINLGFKFGDKNPAADPLVEYHLGGSFSYHFGYGRWGWVLDAGWNREIESPSEVLTLGSYFEIGILEIFASVAEKFNGAGFSVHFDSFNIGMSYSVKAEKFDSNNEAYSRRIYFLLGAEI